MRSLRVEPALERDLRPERVIEGRIAFDEESLVPVLSPFGGARVLRAVAAAGDTVRRGDTLFEVESADLLQAESEALRCADTEAKARATLDLADATLARQRALLRARAASQRDLELAAKAVAHAGAELRTAEAALQAARARLAVLGLTTEQIATLERTRRPDAVAAVLAPADGTVVQRHLGVGQWLGAEAKVPAYTIADLSTVWLIGLAREADLALLQPGQAVQAIVDALPDRLFEARIARLASAIDAVTRRLEVCAELRSVDGALKPGMRASLRIALGDPRRAVIIPVAALLENGPEPAVWLVSGDDHIALRRVMPGIRLGDDVEILEGLRPGERIVTDGALFLDRHRLA
ncbi:efflux RND transporter periplasmic adaptor subunit [Paracraurococcus lichenis]|uniref:Efflux RND transporter periplasmic adaptor subunit n=1 Tax=Paracraurococcus lichenis TaxID=3064888 RepID=A0ABT9ECS3_9PROT|nr:efflux RND transporter periplasmic adaptor subunit [Paracraurococcus sp. LOR1-02]MDO9713922.1 efflux RND transporter periplasmic adaptor subunit [Paracraurococcus sp. LOR1-02]